MLSSSRQHARKEEEEEEEEKEEELNRDSKPRAKRNPPRNRRVNDGDYTEQNDTEDEEDNDVSMKPRTKKKPRSKKSTEQNDTEDEDDNDDSMKPRAKKKPRSKKSSSTSSTMATTSVPLDAFNIVMAFLHPRDLLHTAFTCKSLRDMVSTSMVIKSALVHGGHAKSTMEVLFALTSKHAMHIPSPLRLLRLVNGKVCEFCLYDKVNHARPGIGVFACWACVTSRTTRNNRPLIRGTLTKPWKLSWVRYKKPPTNRVKYDAIFTHDRGK